MELFLLFPFKDSFPATIILLAGSSKESLFSRLLSRLADISFGVTERNNLRKTRGEGWWWKTKPSDTLKMVSPNKS